MEEFLANHGVTILTGIGIFGIFFGIILTILERKLIVTRKPVAGCNGFSSAMYGCVTAASFLGTASAST